MQQKIQAGAHALFKAATILKVVPSASLTATCYDQLSNMFYTIMV